MKPLQLWTLIIVSFVAIFFLLARTGRDETPEPKAPQPEAPAPEAPVVKVFSKPEEASPRTWDGRRTHRILPDRDYRLAVVCQLEQVTGDKFTSGELDFNAVEYRLRFPYTIPPGLEIGIVAPRIDRIFAPAWFYGGGDPIALQGAYSGLTWRQTGLLSREEFFRELEDWKSRSQPHDRHLWVRGWKTEMIEKKEIETHEAAAFLEIRLPQALMGETGYLRQARTFIFELPGAIDVDHIRVLLGGTYNHFADRHAYSMRKSPGFFVNIPESGRCN